jgi:hypothetical protein
MNELAQFLGCVAKVFHLGRVVRGVRSDRPYAKIPTRPLLLSMLPKEKQGSQPPCGIAGASPFPVDNR